MKEGPHRFAHEAMATTFEVLIDGEDRGYAQQASAAAFEEVDRIEKALSRFAESSDIARINSLDAGECTSVGLDTFECIEAAARVNAETGGAFDVTVGPLMACWRNRDGSPRQPSGEELAEARKCVGMHLIELDEAGRTVRVKARGLRIDLGGIGKGLALDKMAEAVRDWSIESCLLSGGGSTVLAMGHPSGEEGWQVGVGGVGDQPEPAEKIALRDRALSGSGTHLQGRHVMDPRTGRPAKGKHAAWALCPSATAADALSTAFMAMAPEEVKQYCAKHPDTSAMLVFENAEKKPVRFGAWQAASQSEEGRSTP